MSAKIPFNQEIADKIIDLLSTKYLSEICAMAGMPSIDTVYNWYKQEPDFHESCRRARDISADSTVERHAQVIEDVYSGVIAPDVGRVVLHALEKRMSILDRARYGEKASTVSITNNTDNRRVDVVLEKYKLMPPDIVKDVKQQIIDKLPAIQIIDQNEPETDPAGK